MSHFGRSGPPDITDTYSLLVLNITFRTTADDLFPLFDKYGKVVDIFIPRDRRTGDSRGFAFVRYKYADEAQKAVDRLDGRVVDGREITVQFAKYGPNAERIKEGLLNHSQDRSTGQGVAVLGEDTEMITEIEIIEGGVTVEAGIGTNVTDTVGGIEITVDEVEAEVPVLITPEAVAEADMMIIAGVLVDRLAVPPQLSIAPVPAGVFPLARILLLGVRVLMDAVVVSGLQLLEVLPPEVDMVIPAAIPREIQMLMTDFCVLLGNRGRHLK